MKRLLGPVLALSLTLLLTHPIAGVSAGSFADAVGQGDAARLKSLLKARADVNATQADGSTALHWAAYHGDVATAAQLLSAGAQPNATMDTGMTPLAMRGLPVPPEGPDAGVNLHHRPVQGRLSAAVA